ncbi:MAG TPA: type II toxin-antitoxin system HicA family toxin [Rhizomicrobium sp.]
MAAVRLPIISGQRVIQALYKAGFVSVRISGSHHLLTQPGDRSRTVVVPVHGNRDLKPGTIRAIVRQAGLSVDEFVALL